MEEDLRFSRVEILLNQQRFPEAEKILNEMLAGDAENVEVLMFLAEVNLQLDKFEKADHITSRAIALAPDEPQLFFVKSRIAIQLDNYNEAEALIWQSIELDPDNANYFALLASIKLARKRYDEALDFSNKALENDGENLLALNTRSMALIKLNKPEESFITIEGALREDPNNAYTHSNYGWALLEKGDHKKALDHFKEALKNDPDFAYAQSGMMEALKARNFLYRAFLKYAFWMGNLTAKYQWGVIIGFYLATRALTGLSKNNEALRPYLIPVIVVLALFAFSTWVLNPISNLFLRFNKYGQLLLSKKEKISSNFVAVAFLSFLVGALMYFLLSDQRYLTLAVFGFAMMVPLSVMFSRSKYKHALIVYTIAMAAIGVSAISLTFLTGNIFNGLAVLFIFAFVVFQWTANFLVIREDNK